MTGTVCETHSPVRADARLHGRVTLVSQFLRVPLLGKLLGASAVLFAGTLVLHEAFPGASMVAQLWFVLLLSFAVTGVLTWLALRPIAELQATAARVSDGDYAARVPDSRLADRDIRGLSTTMNRLLGRVQADQARIQYLAGRSVRAQDIERESISRELRESLAQTAAAVSLQLSAAQRVNKDPIVDHQLERSRVMVSQLSQEMRDVAEALYPGTLSEFGLPNALQSLARRAQRLSSTRIAVDCGMFGAHRLTPHAASALYRVADEALRNIAQHADARNARLTLSATETEVLLGIEDDGRGVDMRKNDPLQSGLGLFSARAVLALAGGELQISSGPGLGTRIVARVPLGPTTART